LFAFPLQTMNGYPRTSWLKPKVITSHYQLTWAYFCLVMSDISSVSGISKVIL